DGDGCELELFGREQLHGCFMRLTVNADIGDGLQPMANRRIEGWPRRQFQTTKEVLFDVFDCILDAPFFIALAHTAGPHFEAIMVGEVQVTRVDLSWLPQRMTQDGRFAVIDLLCPTLLCGRSPSSIDLAGVG